MAARPHGDLLLSASDIRSAAAEGVIQFDDAERLLTWGADRAATPPRAERTKGFNLVSVAYYFAALLMISACAWFLGDKWTWAAART